jgi:hypothetical protein
MIKYFSLVILFLILACTIQSRAQDTLSNVEIKSYIADKCFFSFVPLVINNDSMLKTMISRSECGKNPFDSVDFKKYSLIGVAIWGVDCLSRLDFKITKDDKKKMYHYIIDVYDGGCRAASNFYDRWLLLPKVDPTYTINIERYIVKQSNPLWNKKYYILPVLGK